MFRILRIFLVILGIFVGIVLLLLFAGLLPTLALIVGYGWVASTFFHYRYGRQEEFRNLLLTAIESGAPLAATLWAYLIDRPHGRIREIWVATLLFFLLPGYYWIWHRRHSFDRKVARVAHQLEFGVPLDQALRSVPGVASPETRMAVVIGQSTGRLAECLRAAEGSGLVPVWLEAFPRFAYPVGLLFFITVVTCFLADQILPRYERIFVEMKVQLPDVTKKFISASDMVADNAWIWIPVILTLAALITTIVLSPTARWFFPIFGRLHRTLVQSRVLTSLATLLEVERPAPEALALIAGSGYFKGTSRRRLEALCRRVEQGEGLADCLRRYGLLPRSMVPLVQNAELVHTLPWTLAALGDVLGKRAVRHIQRISMALSPVSAIGIGCLVCFMVLGLFLPLIKVMTELAG
jgi:type II secretory pathway component PulF